jgi:hypothetical protein
MPRGMTGVRNASAELEARRQAGPGAGALWFRVKPSEDEVIRFLEQDDDVFWAMMHEVPVEGRSWGVDVPCLDQEKDGTPCPGCEQELPRRFKGYINVIWYEAPVFKRDSDKKIVKDRLGDPVITGHTPQVAVWSSGIRLFEELDEINANFKGLMSRRFKVKRKGEGLDTKYHISPEDVDSGPQAMTADDKKLEKDKYDLNEFIKPGTYDEFLKRLGQAPAGGRSNGSSDAQPQRANPFMRRNRG